MRKVTVYAPHTELQQKLATFSGPNLETLVTEAGELVVTKIELLQPNTTGLARFASGHWGWHLETSTKS